MTRKILLSSIYFIIYTSFLTATIIFFLSSALLSNEYDDYSCNIPHDTPTVVCILIRKSISHDVEQRVIAIRELGLLGAQAQNAIPFLIRHAGDGDEIDTFNLYIISDAFSPYESDSTSPYAEAIRSLQSMGDLAYHKMFVILVNRCESPDKRIFAAYVLRDINQSYINNKFISILTDKNENTKIRYIAAIALCKIDPNLLSSKYCQILLDTSDDEGLRDWILFNLRKSCRIDKNLINALRKILYSNKESVHLRSRAAYVLAMNADNSLLIELRNMMENTDEEPGIRGEIAEGMGKNNNQDAKEYLLKVSKDQDPAIIRNIINGLSNYKDYEIENILIKYVDAHKKDVRLYALRALSNYNNKESIEKITSIMNNIEEDQSMRYDAIHTLSKINSREASDYVFETLHGDDLICGFAKGALVVHKKFQSVDEYMVKKWSEILLDQNFPDEIRIMAVLSLCNCGKNSKMARQALGKATNDSNREIRRNAVFVLGRIGTKNEITLLKNLIDNNEKNVKEEAKAALEKIRKRELDYKQGRQVLKQCPTKNEEQK